MKQNAPLQLLSHTIAPGQYQQIDLEGSKTHSLSTLSAPVCIFHGQYAGPTLLVCAAVHGDEINGIEIIRQIKQTLSPKEIQGSVIFVPIVNIFGFVQKSRYLPDRRDLNRCFPGSKNGSQAARLAYDFSHNIAQKADYIIDLHTAAIHRSNFPQIRTNLKFQENKALAQAFNPPIIIDSSEPNGSLRSFANQQQIPILTYEAGEALRFNPDAIETGVLGIKNVMKYLNIQTPKQAPLTQKSLICQSTRWLRASQSGILKSETHLGQQVKKGELLGTIYSVLSQDNIQIKSPEDGIIIGKQQLPLIHEGDAIFNLAIMPSDSTK